MRSEQEMYELIVGVAKNDDRILGVYLNGSRAKSDAPRDLFQDYDIVYVVTETASFLEDREWIKVFGELRMVQEPDKLDKMLGRQVDFTSSYGYLMLFQDGNRIDLHIQILEAVETEEYFKDSTVILWEKDGCLSKINDIKRYSYLVKCPQEGDYTACCNDFWWCMANAAKGIWRDELPYAKNMLETVIRPKLDLMVGWWIGCQNNFEVSPGKMGKYFKRYLTEEYWRLYRQTYTDAVYENMWLGIWAACSLFRELAKSVGVQLGFLYPMQDDENMTEYLEAVESLPADAVDLPL